MILFICYYFDEKKNFEKAFRNTLMFYAFLILGVHNLFTFGIMGIMFTSIFIWGYFFYMFWNRKEHNPEKTELDL